MNKTWLDIAGAVLDSVDTDCDIFSGGLNAAISTYEEEKKVCRVITLILFILCALSLVVKYYFL